MTIELGQSYRIYYNDGNPNNRLIHVRGIVDGLFVIRFWLRHKRRWHYAIEEQTYFDLLIAGGHITGNHRETLTKATGRTK